MKKFLTLIIACLLSVFMFSGCSLFELNKQKYYNEVVAVVTLEDDTLTFTKRDLLQYYSMYGSEYVQNVTTEEELKTAIETITKDMVDRQVLIHAIKKVVTLDEQYVWSIKTELYKYFDDTIANLEDEVLLDWDMDKEEDASTTETSEPLRDEKEEYEPKVVRKYDEDGQPYLESVKEDEEKVTDPGEWTLKITDEKVSKEAYKRFIKQLQEQAEEEGRSEKESDVFQYEYDRVYKLLEDNKYIEKYQELLEYGNGTEQFPGIEINSSAVVEKFKINYLRDKELYENDIDAYHEKMKSDDSVVYYRPTSESAAYVNVNQVLLGFTDEQTTMLEQKKKEIEFESGKLEENWGEEEKAKYEEYRSKLAENIVVKYEKDGKILETTPQNVLLKIQNALKGNYTFTEKAKIFDSFIYVYNDDPGVVNADFNYAINLDENVESQMVEEFAEAARKLNKEIEDYNKLNPNNKLVGGNISGLVLTDYGYHILFNSGVAKNIVNDVNTVTWETLYNVTVNPASDKTWFHYIYDQLTDNSVSNGVNALLSSEKSLITEYKIYEKSYKDMWKDKI